MPITDYKGKQLLDQSIADEIQKESDLIVRNKDVSQAWQASSHLKEQISSLPQQEIAPVLGKYRGITTKLKALALPLLSQEDVEHLLKNNLEFLDTTSEKFLSEGLIAWLASQEDENQESLKKKLSSVIDKTSAFAPKILEILRTASPPAKEGIEGRLYGSRIDKVTPSSSTGGERQTQDGTESVARQIFSQAGAKQTEEVFVRRAKALVESRMHDVRTKVDISEYLSRPFQTGGLGLAGEALQNSENLIEQAYLRIHGSMSLRAKPASLAGEAKQSYRRKGHISAVVNVKRDDKIATVASTLPRNDKNTSNKVDKLIKSEAQYNIPQKPNLNGPPASQARALRTGKIQLDDIKTSVKQASKPTGLSDEFSSITISDFRSFGEVKQAIQKILGKLDVLEKDSIASKFAAMRNFRQSPLFRQYLSIGEASLSQGRKLSEAMADISINPDKITENEFFAIADLNGKLK